jgi:hypothetical protein
VGSCRFHTTNPSLGSREKEKELAPPSVGLKDSNRHHSLRTDMGGSIVLGDFTLLFCVAIIAQSVAHEPCTSTRFVCFFLGGGEGGGRGFTPLKDFVPPEHFQRVVQKLYHNLIRFHVDVCAIILHSLCSANMYTHVHKTPGQLLYFAP